MQLISLYIEKFKNLKNFTIDFEKQENLSIIIGNNGSGKSNILEALSAIFASLYSNKEYMDCEYSLKYQFDEKVIEVKREKVVDIDFDNENVPIYHTLYTVNDVVKYKRFLKNEELLPSRVIALYSGEENRLYTTYYEAFTKSYLRDFSKIISSSNNMIYIDKMYWNSALLSFIVSALRNNKDHKKFIKEILKITKISKIRIDYNFSYINKVKKDSPLDILIKNINSERKTAKNYTLKEFLRKIKNYDINALFNILIHASLLQRVKIIEDISFTFNSEDLSFSDLSEGEKKKLLIKAVMDLIGNEKSLILLDEPDAHIHVEGKQEIFNGLKQYATEYKRNIVVTTHSPTLTNCADEKHIVMLKRKEDGFSEIIECTKKERVEKLTSGIWTSEERNIFFASNKPLILLEGKGDADYIKSAIKILDYKLDINILPVGGAPNADSFIDNLKEVSSEKKQIIMIFDRDDGGAEGLKACINRGTNGGRCDNNIYKKNNVYYFLLPKISEYTETDFLIEDYFPIEFKKEKALTLASQGNGFFNKYPKDLKQSLKDELAKPEHHNRTNLAGFKVLLDKIQEIINGTSIQNLVEI